MKKELMDALTALKEAMKEDPRFKRLEETEKVAASSLEVQELHKKMEAIAKDYELALSTHDIHDDEVKKIEKRLYAAKLEFDSHPLVKDYSDAFTTVKDLTLKIDDILFGPYNRKILSIGGQNA